MKGAKVLVTMQDVQRYKVLKDVIDKKLKAKEASIILRLSYIHTLRLKEKVIEYGLKGLLRAGRDAPNKIHDNKANLVADLYKRYYWDFNVMHFKDKLTELHNITLSYESIRKILIGKNLHQAKKKKIVHRQRRRMPKAGMLIQMDSSEHIWLEHISKKWWLIAMIDDATNEIFYAQFFPRDTTYANMQVIRNFVEIKGRFISLYVDKASHFKTTRHGGLHYNVNPEQNDTQIERALNELDITLIPANSPQAKGRIEVRFRLFQDRLIKEMRLAKINNYEQANNYLQKVFLPWHNKKYALKNIESAYTPLPKNLNLDTIFCIKKERRVNNDNTIQILGQKIQIPPSKLHLSFARRKVDVCILQDNRILVLYKGSLICKTQLSKNNKNYEYEKKIETILSLQQYTNIAKKSFIPPPEHPWRKSIINANAKNTLTANSKN